MGSPRRSHRLRLAAGLLVILAAGVVGVAAFSGTPATSSRIVEGGGPAAPFELDDVRKGASAVSLAAFSGTPVVVNFWASWCIPCAREMPVFQAVAEAAQGRVAFVGINHKDSRREARELLERTGARYPAGYDPKGRIAQAYRLRGLPSTVFVSAAGRVLEQRTGEMTRKDLEEAIDRLFNVAVERR